MQVHTPPAIVDDGEFPVHLNPGKGDPFAIITLGDDLRLYMQSAEDCDRLIRAAVEAKRQLGEAAMSPKAEVVPPKEVQMAEFARVVSGRNPYEHPEPEERGVSEYNREEFALERGELSAATLYEPGSDDAEAGAS